MTIRDTRPPDTLPATWTDVPTSLPTRTATRVSPSPTPTDAPTVTHPPRPTLVEITPTYNPSATLSIPTAVPSQPMPEDAITILLLGSDQRPDWEDWHTDAVQYVVVYPSVPAAAILSIPRDLYVYVPGFWMSRINFADMYGEMNTYEGGGLGLLNQTMLYNLGISADYYIKVDFDGLIGLVNELEGIDVPVHCRLQDYWPYADENGEYFQIVLEPGVHHMDGELALWYSRSRKTSSVFSRERRQQQVLEAMWRGAKQMNLLEVAPALYERTQHLYETNLGWTDILALARTAMQLEPADVKRRNIGWYQVVPYTTPYGGAVYLPVWEEIAPIIADLLSSPAANRAGQGAVEVEVWNGTLNAGWDVLAADRLYRSGYIPSIRQADRHDYQHTQLFYASAASKSANIAYLGSLFNLGPENVIVRDDIPMNPSVRLIVGQDYDPCP